MSPLEFAKYCGMRPCDMSLIHDDVGPKKEWFKSPRGSYLCYSCRGACVVVNEVSVFFDRVEVVSETFSFFLCGEVAGSIPVSTI